MSKFHSDVYAYMDSKSAEYAPFDTTRAKRIYTKLKDIIHITSCNIHIIGTNGKGSTGRFIAQSIWECGFSVLHFTSPHLFSFNERFYKNGLIISNDELNKAHRFLQQFDFIHESSYFEYATFLALVIGLDCEYLVMETGIGGEHDSTSVIDYDISVFTKIGIDHTDMLGSSLSEIASTKLKAAQGRVFSHFQENIVLDLFNTLVGSVCYLKHSDLKRAKILRYANKYNLPLFLIENLALASLVLDSLGLHILRHRLDLRGRFEILQRNLIVDVGHNEMAAKSALYEAKRFYNKRFTLIYNSYKDKDIYSILNVFKDSIDKVMIFPLAHERIVDSNVLVGILHELNIDYVLLGENENLDWLGKVLIESKKENLVTCNNYLVFGSFSLAEKFIGWYLSLSRD